jgi:hypothetical protein
MAALAIHLGQFGLFVVAGLCIGVLGGVGQFYRFAAIEAVAPASKGLAVSLTLTGGVLAAFLGPWLARSTRTCSARLSSRASWCWPGWPCGGPGRLGLRLPAAQRVHAVQPARPVKQILADPVGLAVAGRWWHGVMNLLMTATPLAMPGTGQPFDATATVIQWHLVAMLPLFLTGSLVGRIGALRVMLIGALISLAAIAWRWRATATPTSSGPWWGRPGLEPAVRGRYNPACGALAGRGEGQGPGGQ